MTKKVIFNVILNLVIILVIMSGVAAYRVGHMLFLGLSIALVILFVYLKVVLLKYVDRDIKAKSQERLNTLAQQRKSKKKRTSK